jgi:hypothetical protein
MTRDVQKNIVILNKNKAQNEITKEKINKIRGEVKVLETTLNNLQKEDKRLTEQVLQSKNENMEAKEFNKETTKILTELTTKIAKEQDQFEKNFENRNNDEMYLEFEQNQELKKQNKPIKEQKYNGVKHQK